MLFEGGVASSPQLQNLNIMDQTIEMIMEQADIYGLRGEVRATAMAIVREDPTVSTGSAYAMAAYEWDIL
jgi:hypothetical protein